MVQDLEVQNKCLLSKWVVRLCNEDGMWQELLRNKYLTNRTLSGCKKKNQRILTFGNAL